MSGTLRVVLGDQLTRDLSCLRGLERERDVVLMAEVMGEATYVPHHKKKLAFVFSAMRHFAEALRTEGIQVDYVTLDDEANTQSLAGEVQRAVQRHAARNVVATAPGEWRVLEDIKGWHEVSRVDVEIRRDERFLCSLDEFSAWATHRKGLRMEFYYREMRRRHDVLMADGGEPVGGKWNFDAENRKPPKRGLDTPGPLRFAPDATTRAVMDLVADRFPRNFGDLEPFWFAVDHETARQAFDHFIEHALPRFGDYQDAMVEGDDYLFHAAISQYLNVGLLDPLDVCRRAEAAYWDGHAPLNAVEGFVRQILGWREYARGLYWHFMPGYAERNSLEATRPIPDFYWSGETDLHCLAQVIDQTRREALSHHIQRLMVTGNFALLAGIRPSDVNLWYMVVHADAYEWVELPNTHGMALFADGGLMASKPYAAGGNYISKMSDFCGRCRYSVSKKNGEDACPFNYLYWNFLIENEQRLRGNQRLSLVYKSLDKMSKERVRAITRDAERFLNGLRPWQEAAE